jgi:hypothetical protein
MARYSQAYYGRSKYTSNAYFSAAVKTAYGITSKLSSILAHKGLVQAQAFILGMLKPLRATKGFSVMFGAGRSTASIIHISSGLIELFFKARGLFVLVTERLNWKQPIEHQDINWGYGSDIYDPFWKKLDDATEVEWHKR